MNRKILEAKIIVAETFNQIETETTRSIWERNTALLVKLQDYFVAKIDELAAVGQNAFFGDDVEPIVLEEIEERCAERRKRNRNRRRSYERDFAREEERLRREQAARVLERFKAKREEW